MCVSTEKMVAVHPWQDKGIGQAPFRYVAFVQMPSAETYGMNCEGYNNALRMAFMDANRFGIESLGSCDVCGTGIHNHFIIRDSAGKHFKVGCDCVAKTNDSRLISQVENAERLRQKAIRDAKREAKWEAARLQRIQKEADERAANGGKTLSEIAEENRQTELEKSREKFTAENKWLLDVINGRGGDFIESMMDSLELGPLSRLSDRAVSILCEIYSKSFGRSGSKKYQAAESEFYSHIEDDNDEKRID